MEDAQQLVLLRALETAVHRHLFPGVDSVEQLVGKLGMVHVVRHGETQANVARRLNPMPEHLPDDRYNCSSDQEYPYPDKGVASLTEKGQGQAEIAATTLEQHPQRPVMMFVSPQERAYETGRTIAKRLGIGAMHVCPNLREREFGPYAGHLINDVRALCNSRNSVCEPGFDHDELIGEIQETGVASHWIDQHPKHQGEYVGENWAEARTRMAHELVYALTQSQGKPIAIATHGDAARMLVAAINGASWRDVLQHQNQYIGQIQNGQIFSFDMDAMLANLLEKEKTGHQAAVSVSQNEALR